MFAATCWLIRRLHDSPVLRTRYLLTGVIHSSLSWGRESALERRRGPCTLRWQKFPLVVGTVARGRGARKFEVSCDLRHFCRWKSVVMLGDRAVREHCSRRPQAARRPQRLLLATRRNEGRNRGDVYDGRHSRSWVRVAFILLWHGPPTRSVGGRLVTCPSCLSWLSPDLA